MEVDPDDETIREAEVSIMPREEILAGLGIAHGAFEDALSDAIDRREAFVMRDDVGDEDVPPLEEMELVIEGVTYKQEDLAEVEVRGWDD